MIRTVIGSFDSADDADRATRDLRSLGFPDSDINLVVSNVGQGDAETELPVVGDGTGPVAKGAVAGGVLGGAAGLAASLAGLALPGIGPILTAGPIVATLAAAGAGAVAGGVVGKLSHLGGEKNDAGPYAETLERGGTLLTLRTDDSRADEASAILRKAGAIDVARRDEDWRDSYIAHGERKQEQISRMIRYAESADCRMSSLVRHFGDIADGQKPCAICDFTGPARGQ